MSEWQLIDTAPRDGSIFDGWAVNGKGQGGRIADAYYDDAYGWCSVLFGPVNMLFGSPAELIHWMPLPPPPT